MEGSRRIRRHLLSDWAEVRNLRIWGYQKQREKRSDDRTCGSSHWSYSACTSSWHFMQVCPRPRQIYNTYTLPSTAYAGVRNTGIGPRTSTFTPHIAISPHSSLPRNKKLPLTSVSSIISLHSHILRTWTLVLIHFSALRFVCELDLNRWLAAMKFHPSGRQDSSMLFYIYVVQIYSTVIDECNIIASDPWSQGHWLHTDLPT